MKSILSDRNIPVTHGLKGNATNASSCVRTIMSRAPSFIIALAAFITLSSAAAASGRGKRNLLIAEVRCCMYRVMSKERARCCYCCNIPLSRFAHRSTHAHACIHNHITLGNRTRMTASYYLPARKTESDPRNGWTCGFDLAMARMLS